MLLAAGQQPKLQWAPDQFGGYASHQIIVEFQPAIARAISQRLEKTNTSPKSARVAPQKLNNVVSAGFGAMMNRWGVSAIRPLYPFQFTHPEHAAKYGLDRLFIVEVPHGTDTPRMVIAFSAHPREVLSAGVDPIGRVAQFIPDDTDFDKQWNMHNTGQTGGIVDADIDAPEAWTLHTGATGDVIIAIVDTGVDSDPYNGVTPHPEFAGRMVAGINVTQNEPDDATGDDCFHGTHVAGIAAAIGNNATGVAGVSWGAKIMPVDVMGNFDGCSGNLSDLMAGITWASEHGADVINMSLQFYSVSSVDVALLENVLSAAHDLGAVLVCAAGNSVGEVIAYPGRLDQCLAISATNDRDELDDISNFGNELALAAPGGNIWSTWPNGGYLLLSGTSLATPHVSGLAALMKSRSPALTNIEIEQGLKDSAEDLGTPGKDNQFGYGRINAHRALLNITKPLRGACCDSRPGLGGLCSDDVRKADCQGLHQFWTVDTLCTQITCEEVTGACCDSSVGLGGLCTGQVLSADCQGEFESWSVDVLCSEIVCKEVTGACCDRLDGFCRNGVLQSECNGTQPTWTLGTECNEVLCDPAVGACCNTRLGTCSNAVLLADCVGTNRVWTKGDFCSEQTCPDPFVPTVSHWGLSIMTLLLLIGAKIYFSRRDDQEISTI